jgi:hypothetical protein
MSTKLYKAIAQAWGARENCNKSGNDEWFRHWDSKISHYEKGSLPNGSGFDDTPMIMVVNENKIIIHGSYHCMNEVGYYDGWIDFKVTIRPSLLFGFVLDVKADGMRWPRKYADLKEYIAECYTEALNTEINENE